MRILHLCNYIQPKLGYQEYFLAKEHAKMGHTVTVVTSDRYFPFPNYDNTVKAVLGNRFVGIGESFVDGFKIIRLKTIFEYSGRVWLLGLKNTIKQIQPDIIICHGIPNFNSVRILNLKKKLDFKLIFDDHMVKTYESHRFIGNIFYKLFNFKKIEKFADRIIGISSECVDFIKEKYRIKKNVELVPLGADTDLFRPDEDIKKSFRQKNNIPSEAIVLIYTGKLIFDKAPHNIILALDKIKNKITKEVILLFVGNFETQYKEYFYSLVEKTNFKIIHFPSVNNKELANFFIGADIAIWPRQITISTIEASSCGIPIICSQKYKERFKNNNGIPIKEDDIDNLSDAILLLIEDDKLRENMGQNGRNLVLNEMSWAAIAKNFIE